jgi:hypothetical protein
MTGLEEGLAALVGYLSVPLVSLAKRRNWSTPVKVVIAVAVSSAAALILIAVSPVIATLGWDIHLHLADFRLLFLAVFAVQQATYGLQIPGAGTPSVNERLADVGSPSRGA